jgi:hypothetical protein
MKALNQNQDFLVLKQVIEEEKIKPLVRQLLDPAKPFTDLGTPAEMQGRRRGMLAVFSFVEDAVKTKKEEGND